MIEKAHQIIKLKCNKLDSNNRLDLNPANIDILLNLKQKDFIDRCFKSDGTVKRLGFEGDQFTIDQISNLVISYPEQNSVIPINRGEGVFEVPFRFLKYPTRHPVRIYANTDCGVVNIDIKSHSELNFLLNDFYNKPKKAWRRAPATISKDSTNAGSSIYIYSNNNFIIDTVFVDYIKDPVDCFLGGYDSIETVFNKEGYTASDDPVDPEITNLDLLTDLVKEEWESMLVDDYNVAKDRFVTKT